MPPTLAFTQIIELPTKIWGAKGKLSQLWIPHAVVAEQIQKASVEDPPPPWPKGPPPPERVIGLESSWKFMERHSKAS